VKAKIVQLAWTEGNAIDLLENGADFFPALCEAIDGARHSVHLETYIFTQDSSAARVLKSLVDACKRGIKVRVVIDGFGSLPTVAAVAAQIEQAGGHCRIFRPEPRWFARWVPTRKRLRRLHRKVAVIDGKTAFVGGINIVDDSDDLKPDDGIPVPRFDFAVCVRGTLLPYAIHAQELLWIRLNWQRLRRDPVDWKRLRLIPPRKVKSTPAGHMRAALVLRDNLRYRQTFERAYLYGIENAQRDILIANAYFLPGQQFRHALIDARKRGVRVRLLVQGKIEFRMQYHATRALYDPLLEAGVEVYEYMPNYLHAKVAVIDNIASVGSSNIDPFSFLLAREANVVVDDAGFAGTLRTALEAAIESGGRRIVAADYRDRGVARRALDAIAYFMVRLAVSLTGVPGRY
jgi:cardiolipin synthase